MMSNRLLQLLPALLLAALALVLALVGLSRSGADDAASAQAPTTAMVTTAKAKADNADFTYWVSTHNLTIGDTLTKEDLAKISSSTKLTQAVPVSTSLEGKVLRHPLGAGEIVTKTHLQATSVLAKAIAPGYRAIAINVNHLIAAGGLLKPGDLVDVLVSFSHGPDKEKQPTALVLLQNIEVLALHGLMQGQTVSKEDKKRRKNVTALLQVPVADAGKLFLASRTGKLRLAAVGLKHGVPINIANGEITEPGAVADNAQSVAKVGSVDGQTMPADDMAKAVKWKDLFPEQKEKAKPVRHVRRAPSGNKVQVFEGSKARSTYVH